MLRGTLMLLDVALTAEGQVASRTMACGTLARQLGEQAAEGQTAGERSGMADHGDGSRSDALMMRLFAISLWQ